jgi:hypothetical protein
LHLSCEKTVSKFAWQIELAPLHSGADGAGVGGGHCRKNAAAAGVVWVSYGAACPLFNAAGAVVVGWCTLIPAPGFNP